MTSVRQAVALGLPLVAVLGAGRPAAPSAPPRAPDESFAAALARATEGSWERLEVRVECQQQGRMASAALFGDGVGIWDGARQFELERAALARLLRTASDEGFAGMPAAFGGPGASAERRPPRVSCLVAVRIGDLAKQVVQLVDGEQSEPLRRIAAAVLDACREPGQRGLAAASLADGLRMVAEGALAPETFSLRLHRRVETPSGGLGPGWQLRLHGRRAEVAPSDGEPAAALLSPDRFRDLVRALVDTGDLPVNLHAGHYTDLTVTVLDRESHVLARRFAGMTPATHGEAQARFDRVLEVLLALHARVAPDASGSQSPAGSTSLR